MRVLLTESASLTARETLTVLGRRGVRADVVSYGLLTVAAFSRWRGRMIRLPAVSASPAEHLRTLGRVGLRYDCVLPTHEQAWLIAAGRHLLPERLPVAVAAIEAFDRVQSKIEFARTLDALRLPQPRWWLPGEVPRDSGACFVKAAFSTAGRGVWRAASAAEAEELAAVAGAGGSPVMVQAAAPGEYGQVQAVFDHGRLVGVHTSVKDGLGVGGSAAARLSVDHPAARDAVSMLGRELGWHGGLTLDYHHVDGQPSFIECNPRTLEPGHAAAAGCDLPALMIAVSRGESLPDRPVVGRAGVRSHSALALALGAAAASGSRRSTWRALRSQGGALAASEVLTPVREDPPSIVPLVVAVSRTLVSPRAAETQASAVAARYAITPDLVDRVRR